ncbi:hypothetical protein AB205_0027600, partial [Aquarana catesbeiana]
GSSNGNPPERCLRPLYSRDSTQEDHTIPHHHQSGNLSDSKVEVKEEIKEEDEDGVMEEEHKDLYQDTMVESSSYRNPPERCPRPLYSRDSTQEDHTIPHHHQGEDLIDIKVEVKSEEEETYVRDDQQSMEEDEIMRTIKEEDTPTEISTVHGQHIKKTGLSPDCKVEDEDITQYNPGEDFFSRNTQLVPKSVDGPSYCSYPEEPQTVRDGAGPSYSSYPEEPQTVRDGAGPSYSSYPEEPQTVRDGAGPSYSSYPEEPQTVRDGAGPSYSSYPEEPQTVRDGAVLPTEKRFCCPECRKCFHFQSGLRVHLRCHSGERPYSCTQCGKLFRFNSNLHVHMRSHSGEQSFPCAECGKIFRFKSSLRVHMRSHS